ncbi:hypothetical protein D3C81_1572050 [compost metagenome]
MRIGHGMADLALWKTHQLAIVCEWRDRGDICGTVSDVAQAVEPVALYPCVGIQPYHILARAQCHRTVHGTDEAQVHSVVHQRDFAFTGQHFQRFRQSRHGGGVFDHDQAMRSAIKFASFEGAVDAFKCFVQPIINRYQYIYVLTHTQAGVFWRWNK